MVSSRPLSGDGSDALALLVLDQLQPKSPAQGLVFAPCHKCILPAGGRAAGLYQYAMRCEFSDRFCSGGITETAFFFFK